MDNDWKEKIEEFDNKQDREEERNKNALRKLKNNMGHSDGAENQNGYYSPYSINSLSGDPILEKELKAWRKHMRLLKR